MDNKTDATDLELISAYTRAEALSDGVLVDVTDNLKIDSFITDLLGTSGRAILNALVEGYTNQPVPATSRTRAPPSSPRDVSHIRFATIAKRARPLPA
jgi:hypothetical protein